MALRCISAASFFFYNKKTNIDNVYATVAAVAKNVTQSQDTLRDFAPLDEKPPHY